MPEHLYVYTAPVGNFSDADWPALHGQPMDFIAQYALQAQGPIDLGPLAGATLYLFGGRSAEGNPSEAPSFRIEFTVLEYRPSSSHPATHHLAQGKQGEDDCFFSTAAELALNGTRPRNPPGPPEMADIHFGSEMGAVTTKMFGFFVNRWEFQRQIHAQYVQAGRPKAVARWLRDRLAPEFRFLARRPAWTADEGDWPFFAGRPMVFAAQTPLAKNKITSAHLTFDSMVYLFVGSDGDRATVKILEQQMGAQTAEQHYRSESLIDDFLHSSHDETVLRRCVEEGDRHVHEFLLQQKNLAPLALALLAKHAANKELRTTAQKRLKENL